MTTATGTTLDATPAGRALRWLLDCLADPSRVTPEAVAARLSRAATAAVPPAQYAPALAAAAAQLGPVTVDRVDAAAPYEAAVRLVAADGGGWVARCVVEPDPPHLIALTQLAPARLPTDAGCGAPVPWSDIADSGSVGGGADPSVGDGVMADLGELVAAARAELRLPALLAGVVAGGRLARWTAPGYAEVATRRRPTRRTAIRLASVSTVITALATHRLVDAGAVGLDTPVGDLLPTPALVSPNGRPVLVRHLLEHTAGVPTDPRLALGVPADMPVPDLADLVDPEIATLHAPGERFAHSPLGYALLGALVERVSGRPYDDEVVAGVLDPLGMRRTSLRLDDRVARQPLCGYDVDFDEALVATATDPVLRPAAGGISTLEDLAALAGALVDPSRRSLVEPSAATGVPGVATTLGGLLAGDLDGDFDGDFDGDLDGDLDGDMVGGTDGAAVAWHTGGWPGAVTGVYLAPDAGVGLVLAGNAFSPARLAGLDRLGLKLLSWLLPRVTG